MKINTPSVISFLCYVLVYGIGFCLICLIMDLVFKEPTPWKSYVVQGLIFGIIMAFVQKWQDGLKRKRKAGKGNRRKNRK